MKRHGVVTPPRKTTSNGVQKSNLQTRGDNKRSPDIHVGEKVTLSIKKINRLIDEDKPKAIAKYIIKVSGNKKKEEAIEKYANWLAKEAIHVTKSSVLKKIGELEK